MAPLPVAGFGGEAKSRFSGLTGSKGQKAEFEHAQSVQKWATLSGWLVGNIFLERWWALLRLM